MTVAGELIRLPALGLVPAVSQTRRAPVANDPPLPAAWRHRIYRIPSEPSGQALVYGADGLKRAQDHAGRHIDLYA